MLSKRDSDDIADIIAKCQERTKNIDALIAINVVSELISDVFARNPKFDRTAFDAIVHRNVPTKKRRRSAFYQGD